MHELTFMIPERLDSVLVSDLAGTGVLPLQWLYYFSLLRRFSVPVYYLTMQSDRAAQDS